MKKPGKRQLQFTLIYVMFALLGLMLLQNVASESRPKEVAYSEFLADIQAGRLQEVRISNTELTGRLKQSPQDKGPRLISATRLPGIDDTSLIKDMESHGVKFSGSIQVHSWWLGLLLSWIVPLLLLFVLYGYTMRRMGRGAGPLSLGKNRARLYDESQRINVTFADVAGVDEAKAELVEVVDFLKYPAKYQRLGGRIPKGVLLVGAPGTGKTLLARAVSGEAGVPFFSISGSEFVEMFVGMGAARVRDLFEQAKQKAPCIVFIDELDAVGKSRSGKGVMFGHDEREQTLNQLLVEMDGFDTSKGVVIMAATNTPEVLDGALLRPGRFDRQVIVDRPDMEGREAILRVHARQVTLGPDVNLITLAARTPGLVGADLANIVNEAALLAARRGAAVVEMRDLEEAVDRGMLGLEKKSRCMSEEEKERVACHEAGHALVALSLPHADPVHRVSIIPRSIGALGHLLQLPTHEKYLMTKPELEDQVTVMLGGRAAEEIVYDGVVSTGASDDLERASELVRQMVTRFGMSIALGNVAYGHPQQARFLPGLFPGEERNYSERTAEQVDAEVRRIMDSRYEKANRILQDRRASLDRVVRELVRKETLDRQEIQAAIAEPAGVLT